LRKKNRTITDIDEKDAFKLGVTHRSLDAF